MFRCTTPAGAVTAGALLALALAAPVARADEKTKMPTKVVTVEGITEYRLENGLKVLLFHDPSSSKVTVNCTVFVGSRHEGYGETGMAHLLEHMVFKGTPTHPNVPKALRDRGADFNGTTWVDRTNYYETLNASDDNLEFAIKLEADRLVNSFVKREDLASEMTVVRNEFEMGENDPQSILSQRMMAVAFEWHNYGKSTIGNRTDIERVPIDKLQGFYRKYYRPDNAMLIVAGKFDENKALEYAAKYFGALKKPNTPVDPTYTEEPAQDGEREVTLRRVGTVAVVGAVYHIPAGAHDDFPALEVLAQVLDAEPNGQLYKALVAAKKCTNVHTIAYGFHDPGVFEVLANVDKTQKVEDVRAALLAELDKVAGTKFTPEEVERSKTKLAKSWEQQFTRSNRVGVALSDWAAKGDWRLFFLHRDRVAKVTPEDVDRVAQKYFVRHNRTVGTFVPTDKAERASIPGTPDVAALLKDYKGSGNVAVGEFFDPSVENIVKRTKVTKLENGVKVALLPKKTRGEVVTLMLTLHYGNAESLQPALSATNFLGPLMTRGTAKHDRQQLDDELNKLGARLRPSGNAGQLAFSIECKRDKLPAVLALLKEILREPTFPENEFDVLKRQSRDALEKSKTDPQALASRAMQRALNPYPPTDVRYVPTVEESIKRLDAVTVDQVKSLYGTQLGGQNAELVVIGDFDPEPTVKQVEDALKGWQSKVSYKRVERPAKEYKPETRMIDTPDKENAIYIAAMTFGMKDTDPDFTALEVGNFILGGGTLSSRLGDRVRQKEGLSYGVQSVFSADAQDPMSRFLIYAISNPKNVDKVDTAVMDELKKFLDKGIDDKELAEAKKALLAEWKQERSSDGALAGMLQESLEVGRSIGYYGELEKSVENLKAGDIGAAFKKHVDPKKLVIIRAGDFKPKSPSEKP